MQNLICLVLVMTSTMASQAQKHNVVTDFTNGQNTFSAARSQSSKPSLIITSPDSVSMLLSDPSANGTGLDPTTGSVINNIPNSYYATELPISNLDTLDGEQADEASTRHLSVAEASPGTYTLNTVGLGAGDAEIEVQTTGPGGGYITTKLIVPAGSGIHTTREITVAPTEESNLLISQSASTNNPAVGKQLDYTITVTNYGPNPASAVNVMDMLPSDVTFVEHTSDKVICSNMEPVISCHIPVLEVGQSANIIISVVPTSIGQINNYCSVKAFEFDPDLSDNSRTANLQTHAEQDGWPKLHFNDSQLTNVNVSGPAGF